MKINPIGFQFPQAQQVDVNQVQLDTPPSTTALEITSQGLQGIQQASERYSNTTQRLTQSNQQTAQILQDNSARVAQAQSAVLQQSVQNSNNFGQSLQGLQQGIGTLLNYNAKMKELGDEQLKEAERKAAAELAAMEKAQQEQRKSAAVDDLERLQTEWILQGKIRDNGTEAYLNVITKRVAEAALNGDDTVSLTQRYAGPAQEHAKEIYSGMQKTAEEVIQKTREANKLILIAPLNAVLAKIRTSEGADVQAVSDNWDKLQEGIKAIMDSRDFDPITKANAVATAMEQGLDGMSKSNEAYQRLANSASAYRNLTAYASQQRQRVNSSEIPVQEYYDSVNQKAIELGVGGFNPPDPNAETKFLEERKRSEQNLTELRRKEVLSETELIGANSAIVGGLAIDAVLDPNGAGATLAKLAKSNSDVNATQAYKLATDFIKFRNEDKPAYDLARAKKNTEITNINKNFVSWFTSNIIESKAAGNPELTKQLEILRGAGITPQAFAAAEKEQKQAMLDQMTKANIQVVDALIAEQAVEDQNFKNRLAEFGNAGLFLDMGAMKNKRKEYTQQIDAYNERKRQIEADSVSVAPQQGLTGTFKSGPIKQLTKRSYAGKSMMVPFAPNVASNIADAFGGQMYGADRDGTRTHTGLDFGVATGTELLSMVSGTVDYVEPDNGRKGYGLNVGILGPDGLVYHYAHLSATNVVQGQRVSAGEVIALSGESGSPDSQHLHFGVHSRDRSQAFNPEEILAKHASTGGPQPRTAGFTQASIPRGATPIGKSKFLLNGKLYDMSNPKKPVNPPRGGSPLMQLRSDVVAPPAQGVLSSAGTKQAGAQPPQFRAVQVSASKPVRNSFASNRASDYPANLQPDHHHGYTKLANDKPLAAAINRVANKYGMPGQWLADVIAYESAGTFSPHIDNGMGFSGLIQFGDAILQDLGITRAQLNASTAVEQMKYVDQYLGLRLQQSGVKAYKGPEWLVAGINQGNVGIQQVDRYGAKAVLDPSNSDGYTTLLKYMQTLGKYSGRQYDYLGNRAKRTSAVIHSTQRANCSICANLSDSFIRHEAPIA
jgi:murein DD-endopeptidase MepM/ murein hydrolase activator NlpD